MRKSLRFVASAAAALAGLAVLGGGLVALEIGRRDRPKAVPSTAHAFLSRQACVDCHAPIAEEWRQSFHYRSLTGPYWKDVREMGYARIFERTRKACVNCHAPANVLDLAGAEPAASGGETLGVECTPSLLREPRGTIPAARADDPDLGVDCVSCHVSKRGVVGSGRRPTAEHETVADPRFADPGVTAERLCRSCHRATVEAWRKTKFAAEGVTCLECHMPKVSAPSVAGGPPRARRSHRFPADKDPGMLAGAVDATLSIASGRKARVRISNDRVGHFLPSGGNWLLVGFRALDASGRLLKERREGIGRDEALLLDFWPFALDRRIASGDTRDVLFPLPPGPGRVEAVVRYHDWMRVNPVVRTLSADYE